MKNHQQPIQETDPLTAKEAWHKAMEEHKIASLRVNRAEEDVDDWQRKVRNANQNEPITGDVRDNLASLCVNLNEALRRLEDVEAEKKVKARNLRTAWAGWEPFASARALDVPRINRVGFLVREAKKVTDGVAPIPRQTRQEREVPTEAPATIAAIRARRQREANEATQEPVTVPKRIRGTQIRDLATKKGE